MATWTTLSDGLFGATVGAVAVFGAAAVTIWLTRAGDRKREQARLTEGDHQRRLEYVAEVIGTFKDVEVEVRAAPFARARSQGAFLRAAMLFYVAVKPHHAEPAEWLLRRNDEYGLYVAAWRRVWWCPVIGRRRAGLMGTFLGEVIGALVLWSAGEIPDTAFENAERSPSEIVRVANIERSSGRA